MWKEVFTLPSGAKGQHLIRLFHPLEPNNAIPEKKPREHAACAEAEVHRHSPQHILGINPHAPCGTGW